MHFDQVFDHRETDAEAAVRAVERPVSLQELIEDLPAAVADRFRHPRRAH